MAERAAGQEGWGGPRSTSRQTAAVTLDTLSQTGRWGPEQAAEGGRHLRQRQQLENNWENKDKRKGGRDAETRDLGAMSHQTARTHLLLRPRRMRNTRVPPLCSSITLTVYPRFFNREKKHKISKNNKWCPRMPH